jgi:hypothetical protein
MHNRILSIVYRDLVYSDPLFGIAALFFGQTFFIDCMVYYYLRYDFIGLISVSRIFEAMSFDVFEHLRSLKWSSRSV